MDKSLKLRVVGVMTGTSCDGLDVACLEFDPSSWSPVWEASLPYPQALKKRVLDFQKPNAVHSAKGWMELNRDLGIWYGQSLKKILSKYSKNQSEMPDLIANHGQTLAHFPSGQGSGKANGMTLQLGDASRIAVATGLTVASQFREGDLAVGGQGAPLLPLYHKILAEGLADSHQGVAFHNLGGISNLTYVSPTGEVIAFDTGPASLWIDAAVRKITRGKGQFDRDGRFSSQGAVDPVGLKKILKHPYFSRGLPKSTGRDDFPDEYFFKNTKAKGNDLVTTAVEVTVMSIVRSYRELILKKKRPLQAIYLCGGGARNSTLVQRLKLELDPVSVLDIQELGLDPQFIEAQGFAFFGMMTLLGHPLGGSWTGARKDAPPAHLTPGENWQGLMKKVNAFLADS